MNTESKSELRRASVKLPSPHEQLAGCVWLPRILAKARLLKTGDLPADYEARFCHPTGVDGLFLAHFGISREDIVSAAAMADERVSEWFLARSSPERIVRWNDMALNLGRPGYPKADRFPVALATTYKHLAGRKLTTFWKCWKRMNRTRIEANNSQLLD